MKDDTAAPQSLDALTRRIRQEFPQMSPQFQIGARFLLDFPAEVPVASMRRIAVQAGVQPATLVRLARFLGYDGWDGLKAVFVGSLRQHPSRYAAQAREVVRGKDPQAALARSLAVQSANISLLHQANGQRLAQAAQLLAHARRVHVAGFRASFAPAYTFQYLYRLFRPSVYLLRGDAGTLEMELRALCRRDAVVVVGFAPYSHEIMAVARAARDAGCTLVALCDSDVAPMALQADCTLVFATETPSFFPSSVAASALVEVLVERLLAQSGKRAIADIERTEQQLHRTGAYFQER